MNTAKIEDHFEIAYGLSTGTNFDNPERPQRNILHCIGHDFLQLQISRTIWKTVKLATLLRAQGEKSKGQSRKRGLTELRQKIRRQ